MPLETSRARVGDEALRGEHDEAVNRFTIEGYTFMPFMNVGDNNGRLQG